MSEKEFEIIEDKKSKHIRVVLWDDDEYDVYENDKRLTEREIVDLLVEGFEDCDKLVKEKEELIDAVNQRTVQCDELYVELDSYKKEAKHQQGQKQRLRNYLKQYLNDEEINSIMNNDKWLDDYK